MAAARLKKFMCDPELMRRRGVGAIQGEERGCDGGRSIEGVSARSRLVCVHL